MHTNTHVHAWHRPHAEALILRPTIYAQICIHIHIHMCIHACIYILIHTCTYIHIYSCPHTYTHTLIYTHTYKMYICTHTSTPGTMQQRTHEELMQTQGALHVSFVRRNQTTFSTSNARTWLYPLPETPIPLNPPSSLPNRPQNSSRTAGQHGFTVLHWSDEHGAWLWRSSGQLHNGPVRSCRKIGGKAAVQQSSSRWARRTSSPRMTKVTVHGEMKGQWRTTKPRNSSSRNHDSAAPRQHPLICTGTEPIHPADGLPKLRAHDDDDCFYYFQK